MFLPICGKMLVITPSIEKIKMKPIKLALAQCSMQKELEQNLAKSLEFCDRVTGCDLLFFPEIQLSPFFPQYEGLNAGQHCPTEDSAAVQALAQKAAKHHYYLSPNVYLEQNGMRYDTSLWISPEGEILDKAKMVHIAQAPQFYEKDYYTPSDDGFKVFDTPFGKIGIVICYDRHLPESIRTCVLKGANLVIIPTANTKAENMELFEWEIRVQAMQNQVFVAMCNRVETEDAMEFSGESLVVHPGGEVLLKADDREQLLTCELDLSEAREWRSRVPYLKTRRPEWYL